MADALCAECHADIAEQHAHSMHPLISFNNPGYLQSSWMAPSQEHTRMQAEIRANEHGELPQPTWPRSAPRSSLRRSTWVIFS
jgi:hypothetical protein